MSTIVCRRCGVSKPASAYSTSKRKSGAECRACKSAYDAGYRAGKKRAAQ